MDLPLDIVDEDRKGLMDSIEMMLAIEGFAFERKGEDEVRFGAKGQWCEYQLWFTPSPDGSCLQLCLSPDLSIPENQILQGLKLISRINEHIPFGHFDIWSEDQSVVWRHALLTLTPPTMDDLYTVVSAAVGEVDRFYPALYGLIKTGLEAEDALDAALFETVGHA